MIHIEFEAFQTSKLSKVHPNSSKILNKETHTTTKNIDFLVTKLTKDLQSDRVEIYAEHKIDENKDNSMAYPTFENFEGWVSL